MNDQNTTPHPGMDALRLDGPSRNSRRLKLWFILGMLILAAVIAIFSWNLNTNGDAIQYKTHTVQRGDLTITVTATGNLAPTNQVEVGSELSGIIKTVLVDFNDQVKTGQPLATLDTSKLEAQVLQSRAALAVAQAKVMLAQATVTETAKGLERLQELSRLSDTKAVSQRDLDIAQAAFDRAQADVASTQATVNQTKASLEINETDLAKAVIRSPINGVILSRTAEPGQTVAASLQAPVLFTIAEDLAQMELRVDVDEADVGQIQKGMSATFFVDAYPDRTFPAEITQVRYGAKTVAGVVTYETVLNVDNSDLSLRPGMTATATITVKVIDNAVLVPNIALRFSPPARGSASNRRAGSVLGMLLPRGHRGEPDKQLKETSGGPKSQQRVWVQQDGQLTPTTVTTGATDGAMTEIIGNEIEPGAILVVDTADVKR